MAAQVRGGAGGVRRHKPQDRRLDCGALTRTVSSFAMASDAAAYIRYAGRSATGGLWLSRTTTVVEKARQSVFEARARHLRRPVPAHAAVVVGCQPDFRRRERRRSQVRCEQNSQAGFRSLRQHLSRWIQTLRSRAGKTRCIGMRFPRRVAVSYLRALLPNSMASLLTWSLCIRQHATEHVKAIAYTSCAL